MESLKEILNTNNTKFYNNLIINKVFIAKTKCWFFGQKYSSIPQKKVFYGITVQKSTDFPKTISNFSSKNRFFEIFTILWHFCPSEISSFLWEILFCVFWYFQISKMLKSFWDIGQKVIFDPSWFFASHRVVIGVKCTKL